MTTVNDVPANALIGKLSEQLAKEDKTKPPEWVPFVRTGVHTEKSPDNPDWWHTRQASILRKVYLKGPIGVERLAAEYGGARARGSRPEKARGGSRSILRHALQQLEAIGLIQNIKGRGRVVTPKGRSVCDNVAHDVAKDLEKTIPELTKY